MRTYADMDRELETLQKQKEKGFAEWIFYKVFHTDVLRLVQMKDLWKDRAPPKPLDYQPLRDAAVAPPVS